MSIDNNIQDFDIAKYANFSQRLNIGFKSLENGIQFIYGKHILTFYKTKFHDNWVKGQSAHQPYVKSNIEHIVKLRFKLMILNTTKQNIITPDKSAAEHIIKHTENKLKIYMERTQSNENNAMCVMLSNLILEFQQYL